MEKNQQVKIPIEHFQILIDTGNLHLLGVLYEVIRTANEPTSCRTMGRNLRISYRTAARYTKKLRELNIIKESK